MEDARSRWRTQRRLERKRKRLTAVLSVLLAVVLLLFLFTFFSRKPDESQPPSETGDASSENGALPTPDFDNAAEIHTIVYTDTAAVSHVENRLVMPVNGSLTSGYGLRSDPITGEEDFHPAVDLAAPEGDPILAALDGVVSETGWDDTYGRYVRIWHGGGLETQYGHCSELLVQPGDAVSAGDTIALVGATGRATGPHLDFQVFVDGVNVDPTSWLDLS